MARVALTDGSGSWFDTKAAILFKEDTNWDGRNQISVPTGSQWDHEWLYYTKSGKWVLNDFSNYRGSAEGHRQIDEQDAIVWLIQNHGFERDEISSLPAGVQDAVKAGFAAAEI